MPRASVRTAYSAFICHAKTDDKKAWDIVAALEEHGLRCWIAPRDVRPGHAYGDEIVRGIEKSRACILILSKASNESDFVAREVERAVSKGKAVYAIRVENVQPSPSLELFISGTQWIDAWSGPLAPPIEALANSLGKSGKKTKKAAAQTAVPISKEAVPTVAPISGPEPKPVMPPRSRRTWLIGGAAAAIAVAVIGVAVLLLKPFGPGGDHRGTVDDPDYQVCAKMSGDAAIKFCSTAIDSGKFAGVELANLHVMRGWTRQYDELDAKGALADYEEAIRLDPSNALAYNNRGNLFRIQGKLDLALKDIDESIRIKPLKYAFLNRGLVFQAKADYDDAIKAYNEAILIEPNYLEALLNRGDAYRAKGDLERAKDDYQSVLSLNPDPQTKQSVVATLSALGVSTADKETDSDYQACVKLSGPPAFAACDRAIASQAFGGSDLAELYRLRGWERRNTNKDIRGAMSDYNQAIKIDPENATAYLNRGSIFSDQNQLDRAIQDYNEAIRIYPNYLQAFLGRGDAYRWKGDLDRARDDYTKALTLNPDDATKQKIEKALQEIDQKSGAATQSGDAASSASPGTSPSPH